MHPESVALDEQLAYYGARAAEYDQWWLRRGRYDRGTELNERWQMEAAQAQAALAAFRPTGRILELACGTGLWTEKLVAYGATITAVDGSAEMLSINAHKLKNQKVTYQQANLFEWEPTATFDVVFFSFWLSHVPPERFTAFWELVRKCLAPGGRVFFLDSRHEPTSTAADHVLPDVKSTILQRKLNDGRAFQIYKVFYNPASLEARLAEMGWKIQLETSDHYFLWGSGEFAS